MLLVHEASSVSARDAGTNKERSLETSRQRALETASQGTASQRSLRQERASLETSGLPEVSRDLWLT